MAHAAMAGRCPRFDHFLAVSIDGKFRQALRVADFDTTLKWASTFEAAARTPASTLELQQMVQALGASDSEAGDWLLQAEQLYDKLTMNGVRVWWDKRCLPPGKPWEDGFVDGLLRSEVGAPHLQRLRRAITAAPRCMRRRMLS